MAIVLITDGEQRTALALVRSLGKAGHRPIVCSSRPRSLAGSSRYAHEEHLVPSPLRHPDWFAAVVARIAREVDADLVIPVTDPAMLSLLECPLTLGRARIPFPDLPIYRSISDKEILLQEAVHLGMAVPAQRVVSAAAELTDDRLAALTFPLVIKPTRSVGENRRDDVAGTMPQASFGGTFDEISGEIGFGPGWQDGLARALPGEDLGGTDSGEGQGGTRTKAPPQRAGPTRKREVGAGRRIKLGVRHASSPEELRRQLDALPSAAFPCLLQERIVGPGVGIFLLVHRQQVVASFSHRRIREKPPSGGVSVYREAIPADPALVEISRQLLARFGWEGVAMIEYKIDASTGRAYLMEVNGRFWGSLQLAVDAGVDFPALLVDRALGGEPEPVTTYRTGVRSRWWWGDVDQLLLRLRKSRRELSLPPDVGGRGSALIDFLRLSIRNDRSEILRMDDPQPFLRETIDWFRRR